MIPLSVFALHENTDSSVSNAHHELDRTNKPEQKLESAMGALNGCKWGGHRRRGEGLYFYTIKELEV